MKGSVSLGSMAVWSAAVLAAIVASVNAWAPPHVRVASAVSKTTNSVWQHPVSFVQPRCCSSSSPGFTTIGLCMAKEGTAETAASSSSSSPMSFLEEEEWKIIEDLHGKASKAADSDEDEAFQKASEELLPALTPALIMKLRTGEDLIPSEASQDTTANNKNDRLLKIFLEVSRALNTMTDRRLQSARDTLAELMNAGEIKKLDALIGKSARNQKLDVAFFQVLQMNLRDAAEEAQNSTEGGSESVDRFQILQHIYTRCQEEVEKVINPGTALLNKLLRTEVDSIRKNQLNHYLCPAATTITSPDGKEIVLNNPNGKPSKSLVSHSDFCDAIGNAVKQIRTVENSGAASPVVAADLVESIRQVAKEARIVIGEHYGGNSTEVIAYEDALEPVFRPTSPDSPYIKGEQQQQQQQQQQQ